MERSPDLLPSRHRHYAQDAVLNNVINKFSRHQYAKYKKYLSSIKGGRIPVSGDYYVVSTNALNTDFSVIADIPHNLVFENKLFRIYKIR